MQPQTGSSGRGEPARDIAEDYRRLLNALASRAHRLGSRDPEAAAQETFVRSWENAASQPALEYYFRHDLYRECAPPVWTLERLLAWLHTVLRYVVSEERSRIAYKKEDSLDSSPQNGDRREAVQPQDASPHQLQLLLDKELQSILEECFLKLDQQYRTVLRMRAAEMKYDEIAGRMKVNENTIATWLSRGIRDLAKCVGRRMHRSGNI